jgi:hypothetical protein
MRFISFEPHLTSMSGYLKSISSSSTEIRSELFVSQSHQFLVIVIQCQASIFSSKYQGVVSQSQALTFSSSQLAETLYFTLQLSHSSHSIVSTVTLSQAITFEGQVGSSLTTPHSLVSTLRQSGFVDCMFIVHLLLHPPSPQQGLQHSQSIIVIMFLYKNGSYHQRKVLYLDIFS